MSKLKYYVICRGSENGSEHSSDSVMRISDYLDTNREAKVLLKTDINPKLLEIWDTENNPDNLERGCWYRKNKKGEWYKERRKNS